MTHESLDLSLDDQKIIRELTGNEKLRLYSKLAASTENAYRRLFELREVYVPAAVAFTLSSGLFGGLRAHQAGESFKRLNEQAVYAHRVQSVRDWHSAQFRAFFKYGFRFGWRVSFLVSSVLATQSLLWIYTDDYRLSHYSIGGCIGGTLYRMTMGVKGMFVGSLLGTILGTMSGSLLYLNQVYINKSEEIKAAENRRHKFYLEHLNSQT